MSASLSTRSRPLRSSLVATVVLFLLAAGSSACVHSRVRRAEAAHDKGDLAEAERLLEKASDRGRAKRRAATKNELDRVRGERLELVERLYAAALAVESREDERVAEALAWYEAAFALSAPHDSTYEEIEERLLELRALQEERLGEYERAKAGLSREARSCEGEDVDAALRELVSLAYIADEPPPAKLAWRLAEACFSRERYEQAARLSERARRLETAPHVRPPARGSLLRLALSLHRTGSRGPLLAAVVPPEEETVAEEKPPPPRRRSARRRPMRPAPPPVEEATLETDDAPAEPPEEVPEAEPPPPTPEARLALARVTRVFSEGDAHGALVALDEALERLADHPERHILARQADEWEPERARLVSAYLTRAETELAAQRPADAAGFYELILELEPEHSVSRDRLRRIERLRELREP